MKQEEAPGRRVARGPIDPRLLRHARTGRAGVALLAAIGIGQAAATIAVAVALCRIVAPSLSRSWLYGGSRTAAILLLGGAFAARGLLSWAEQVVARRTAARVTDELRRSLLAAVVRRGPAWVASYGAGRLTTVLGTGLDSLRPWFSGYLPSLALGVLLPPAVIAVLALVDPASAVIAVLTLPLVPLLGALVGWATQARARQRWAADARLAGHFLDVVQGLATLRMYGRAERQIGVIADLTDRHRRATMRVLRVAFLSSTALDLVGTLSVGLIAVQAGLRVAGGSMSLAPALLAILLAPEAYRPLREMAARYHAATDATAVIADVDEILAAPGPAVPHRGDPHHADPSSAGAHARINAPETAPGASPTTPAGTRRRINARETTAGAATPAGAGGGIRPPETTVITGPTTPAGVDGAITLRDTAMSTSSGACAPYGAGRNSEAGSVVRLGGISRAASPAEAADTTERGGDPAPLSEGAVPLDGGTVALEREPAAHGGGTAAAGPGPAGHSGGTAALEGQPAAAGGGEEVAGFGGDAEWTAVAETVRWGVLAAGVRATYPGAGGEALWLPELSVRAGEMVALRGPSGAGKSTALRVFAGLHPAEAGAVAVGRAFHLPQRPALPHARTVGQAFPADATADEVRDALHLVGLDAEITPETPLGEHANGISAGQRQRLALAALLHRAGRAGGPTRRAVERPRLDEAGPGRRPRPVVTLLLDEPTAHLDPAAERLVAARLREFARRGCAVLVVAHRPALLAAADRVVEIQPPASHVGDQDRPVTQVHGRCPGTTPACGLGRPTGHIAELAGDRRQPLDETGRHATTGRAGRSSTPHHTGHSRSADPANHPPIPHHIGQQEPADPANQPPTPHDAGQQEPADPADRPPAPHDAERRSGGVWWRRPWVAVLLGAGSVLAGILLTGSAAWLLVRAAELPPVLTLSAAVVLVRGSAVARPLLRYLERLVAHDVAFARLGRRRARVYARLIPRVPGPRLHRRGDLLTRLVDDVDARVDGLLRGRLPALTALVTVIVAGSGTAVLLAAGTDAMTPALIAPLTLGVLISGVIAPAVAGWQADRQDTATGVARAALRDAMVETVDGVEELGAGSGRPGVPERRSRALADLEARAARMSGLAAAIAHLGWAVAAAGTALALHDAGIPAEWSAVLLLGVIALGEPVVALPESAIAARRAAGAERRVAALTTGVAGRRAGKDGRNGAEGTTVRGTAAGQDAVVTGEVHVRGLVAGWDPTLDPVLDGLDLHLPPGAKVAVTGRSGSGKSTLGAVLGGLLAPRAGTVRVGGRAVLVGDETGHVFASTVRENLRLAAPAATDERLVAVARRVGLGSWLAGLPDGLDTWLGAGGSTMSGGQRRRFATARALLAEPALLILDEPTEGIDEDGARELMADLLDAASGRTVLVFAHRAEGLELVTETRELSGGRLNVRLDRSVL
ncbi:thiol reductant ABC exporter subunit CydC [Actinoplanes teichomyceticus]|uniref:thiol reductant ABC exporter subunit CydC n=1 Tax=Actinoplanes teichomyceticus TaxID=1867 RepID=UPI001EF3C713|nr:thiol reductant ABC exporter subunit CydC [Actinoplanes teichomyceticus]